MRFLKILLGILIGAIAGAVLGFAAGMALAFIVQLQNPDDPSAGSIAILVIVTTPAGLLIGAVAGGVIAVRRTSAARSDSA